jgi:glycosyltransferase involved in cell wall biosynthesis
MTTQLIAISERQRAELIRLHVAPPSKIVVIPVGFALDGFLQPIEVRAARESLGVDAAASCIALVARLVPIKDVPTFLRSVATVAKTFPNIQALIVGDGVERVSLERLAYSLGISAHCRFTGWVADLREVYAAADVAVLSSINEGAGASLVEAMASGKPVVATSVGGVPEIVSPGTGLLVPPRDPEALAAAIVKLLGDPALGKKMGTAARESALAKYSASRLVTDLDNLYRKLLGEKSGIGDFH